jgi:hypothetical protein
VEGLRSLAQGRPSVAGIKEMIEAINGMDPQQEDLESLLGISFLPIVDNSATPRAVRFQSCRSNFSIRDQTKLADIFKEHAKFLDFSLEQIRELEPFLQALNLGDKYLSRLCTQETACSDDGTLDMELTEGFNQRAYYLLR